MDFVCKQQVQLVPDTIPFRAISGFIMIYSDLFEEILAKPTLYVGNANIRHIAFYMKGYIYANWEKGHQDTSDLYFGFQNWVADSYAVSKTLGWQNIITLFSSSEDHAFEITVKCWNEYKAEVLKNNGS